MNLFIYLRKLGFLMLGLGALVNVNSQELVWSIEAENYDDVTATNTKTTYQEEGSCYMSGCAFVENISQNSFFTYKNVSVPSTGTYELNIYYTMVEAAGRGVGVIINGQEKRTIWITESTGTWSGAPAIDPETEEPIPGTEGTKAAKMLVYLEAGANTVKIGGSGTGYAPNIDRFEMYTTSEVIEKPQDQACAWHWDYTDEAIVTSDNDASIKNLIDNDGSTIYRVSNTKTATIDFEFPYSFRLAGFLIYSGQYNKSLNLDLIEVQASDDKVNWVNSGKAVAPEKGFAQVVRAEFPAGYKYIRLKFETEDDDIEIGEFQLFGHPQVESTIAYPDDLIQVEITGAGKDRLVSPTGGNGLFTTSSNGLYNFAEIAANAVDGIRNKYTLEAKSFWMQFDFNDATLVRSYSLAIGATSNMDRNPKSWTLLASADWGTTWDVIDEVTDFVYPSCNYANMKFNVANPNPDYMWYRIEITNNGASMSHISEYQLFGEPLPDMESDLPTSIELPAFVNRPVNAIISSSKETIRVQALEGFSSFKIYNISGSLIHQNVLHSSTEVKVKPGLYIVELTSANNISKTKILVR